MVNTALCYCCWAPRGKKKKHHDVYMKNCYFCMSLWLSKCVCKNSTHTDTFRESYHTVFRQISEFSLHRMNIILNLWNFPASYDHCIYTEYKHEFLFFLFFKIKKKTIFMFHSTVILGYSNILLLSLSAVCVYSLFCCCCCCCTYSDYFFVSGCSLCVCVHDYFW